MRRTIVVACVTVAMVATFVVTGHASPQPSGESGSFASLCRFDHRLPDDPIVAPGAHGGSHDHDFFGNTTTEASSTHESLLDGGTSCSREADTAAYWTPSLLVRGTVVRPLAAQAYYNARGKPDVVAPPAGLKLIAGDSKATQPQPIRVVNWNCGDDTRRSEKPYECGPRTPLRLQIRFPDCWDGTNLDAADHKSHLAYSARSRCPSTHPVPIAGLRLTVFYAVRDVANITLSSGSALTGHADFFNAWDQGELDRLVAECLNARRHCGRSARP